MWITWRRKRKELLQWRKRWRSLIEKVMDSRMIGAKLAVKFVNTIRKKVERYRKEKKSCHRGYESIEGDNFAGLCCELSQPMVWQASGWCQSLQARFSSSKHLRQGETIWGKETVWWSVKGEIPFPCSRSIYTLLNQCIGYAFYFLNKHPLFVFVFVSFKYSTCLSSWRIQHLVVSLVYIFTFALQFHLVSPSLLQSQPFHCSYLLSSP